MTSVSSGQDEFKQAAVHIENAFNNIRIAPRMDHSKMNQGQLMAELRYAIDLKEAIEAKSKLVDKQIAKMKERIIDLSQIEGTNKFTSDRLTVSVSERDTVKMTGDWAEIQAYLLEHNMGYVVQRRITEGKLADAFYGGSLRLPDGLDLDTIRITRQTRKG